MQWDYLYRKIKRQLPTESSPKQNVQIEVVEREFRSTSSQTKVLERKFKSECSQTRIHKGSYQAKVPKRKIPSDSFPTEKFKAYEITFLSPVIPGNSVLRPFQSPMISPLLWMARTRIISCLILLRRRMFRD